ncbi:hypothetical protein WKI13_13580 [Teredinibacter turnerae]
MEENKQSTANVFLGIAWLLTDEKINTGNAAAHRLITSDNFDL